MKILPHPEEHAEGVRLEGRTMPAQSLACFEAYHAVHRIPAWDSRR
jgi:hypothetical protein